MDPISIATAVIPLASSLLTRIVGHFTGGAKPQTVDEAIKLMEAETAKAEALAKLDASDGNTSKWVSNLRGAIRPATAVLMLILFTGCVIFSSHVPQDIYDSVFNLTGAVVFYLFGERSMVYVKKK